MVRTRVVLVVLALLGGALASACGGSGDEAPAEAKSGFQASETTTSSGATAAASVSAPATTNIGKSFWHAGWKVDLGTATYAPAARAADPPTLTIAVTFSNLGKDSSRFSSQLVVTSGASSFAARGPNYPTVPGSSTGKGEFLFEVDREFKMADATLRVGNPENNQALVPFGSAGKLVSLEPVKLSATGVATVKNLEVNVKGGELRADVPDEHDQIEKGHLALTLNLDLTNNGTFAGGYAFSDDNLSLKLPDGTSVAPDKYPIELLRAQSTKKDVSARFTVDDPAAGTYSLVVRDDTDQARPTGAFEFAVP